MISMSQRQKYAVGVKRFASIIVGIAVALALAEGLARFYAFLDHPPLSHFQLFDSKIQVAENLSPSTATHPIVVLMGDSLMTRGIFPELLEARLRERDIPATVANLAVSGTPPNIAARQLNYLLSKVQTKPDLVLYNFEPMNTNLATYPLSSDEVIGSLLEETYFGRCVFPKDGVSSSFLCDLENRSLLVRHRGYILGRIQDFFATAFNATAYRYASSNDLTDGVISDVSRRGSAPVHSTINETVAQERLPHYKEEFQRFGPRNKSFLFGMDHYDSISQIAHQNDIDFGLVWLPHLKDWYQDYFYTETNDHQWYLTNVQNYTNETPGNYTIDINKLPDEYLYYDDYRHLNAYGAYEATNMLAEALADGPLARYATVK